MQELDLRGATQDELEELKRLVGITNRVIEMKVELELEGHDMKPDTEWIKIHEAPFRIECERCGSVDKFRFPDNVTKVRKRLTEFVNRHRECESATA